MACNGLNLGRSYGYNNSCIWTLVIVAVIVIWLNCGCSFTGIGDC